MQAEFVQRKVTKRKNIVCAEALGTEYGREALMSAPKAQDQTITYRMAIIPAGCALHGYTIGLKKSAWSSNSAQGL